MKKMSTHSTIVLHSWKRYAAIMLVIFTVVALKSCNEEDQDTPPVPDIYVAFDGRVFKTWPDWETANQYANPLFTFWVPIGKSFKVEGDETNDAQRHSAFFRYKNEASSLFRHPLVIGQMEIDILFFYNK